MIESSISTAGWPEVMRYGDFVGLQDLTPFSLGEGLFYIYLNLVTVAPNILNKTKEIIPIMIIAGIEAIAHLIIKITIERNGILMSTTVTSLVLDSTKTPLNFDI